MNTIIDMVGDLNKMFHAIAGIKEPEKNLIKAQGLDPKAPYSLGNKDYYYKRECNSGHTNLTDDEIGFTGGVYDGFNWTVPVCMRCISKEENKRLGTYSHYTPYHLKEA
jgi:hypothetical protein